MPAVSGEEKEGGPLFRGVRLAGALHQASEVDSRHGAFLDADLAEYLLPAEAGIGSIEVAFIDEPDTVFSSAGAQGLE